MVNEALRTARRRPWVLVLLIATTQLPLVTLMLRALGASWNYPDILPVAVSDHANRALVPPRVWESGLTSVTLALATGLASAAIGVVIARALLRATRATRRVATLLMFFPVIAPPVALGVGLQVVLLRASVGASWIGVWLAHVIPAVGYVTLYFLGALSGDDASRDEAARTLGATAWQTWWRVTFQGLRRRLGEAVVLGGLVSWGQLALTLLVGGGVVRTMPVEILAIIRSGDDHLAAIAALMLTAPPLLALSVLRGGAERTGVPS